MKKNELAVCAIDKLDDSEVHVVSKELKAFNLSAEENDEIIELFKGISPFRAVEILKDSDANTKKESASLCIVALNADGECSDKEQGAYFLAKTICDFPSLSFTEAKEHLNL